MVDRARPLDQVKRPPSNGKLVKELLLMKSEKPSIALTKTPPPFLSDGNLTTLKLPLMHHKSEAHDLMSSNSTRRASLFVSEFGP